MPCPLFIRNYCLFIICLLGLNKSSIIAQSLTESSLSIGIDHAFEARGLLGGGAAFFDYDQDGDDDLYLTRGLSRDWLYTNNGDGTFSRINDDIGLFASVQFNSTGVTTGDIDNDGDRDIFVTTWEMFNGSEIPMGRNLLYLNNGDGTFTEIGLQAGLTETSFSLGAIFFDYDKDGFLDIYVLNYVENPIFTYDSTGIIDGYAHDCYPNFLYKNNGDLTFTEVATTLGVEGINGCSMSAVASDYDLDNDLDIHIANDFGYWLEPNVLYENTDGMGGFTPASDGVGANIQAFSMGIAAGDYDRDLDIDYYVASIGSNILLENQNGQFTDVAAIANVENELVPGEAFASSWGVCFLDVDNDGWQDLYVSNGRIPSISTWATSLLDPDKLYRNNGDKTFTDVSVEAGINDTDYNRGIAYSDYDLDGDLDLMVISLEELGFHSKFYVNETNNDHHFIQFKLEGVESNRDAYGAKVYVHAGGEIFLQELYGGGDVFASQNSSILHFGLGTIGAVDSVLVDWPNGHLDTIIDEINIDQLNHIKEGIEEPVATNNPDQLLQISVQPNPFSDQVRLTLTPSYSDVQIKIQDVNGKIIWNDLLPPFQTELVIEIPEQLAAGFYFLSALNDETTTLYKLIKN